MTTISITIPSHLAGKFAQKNAYTYDEFIQQSETIMWDTVSFSHAPTLDEVLNELHS